MEIRGSTVKHGPPQICTSRRASTANESKSDPASGLFSIRYLITKPYLLGKPKVVRARFVHRGSRTNHL